jgi:hypothetical protein
MKSEITAYFFYILTSCFFSIVGQAQTHLTIGVYMNPKGYSKVDSDQIAKLETRIVSVITSGGSSFNVSASRITSDFHNSDGNQLGWKTLARGIVCLPKFEIFNSRVVDTGIKKVTVVDASLTLSIQYIHEDIIFTTLVINLQGSGSNEYQAVNDVIRNIRPQDPKWQSFVKETREKIISYYEIHCDGILAKAKQLDKLNQPIGALQIIWPIPQEVDCFERVNELIEEIYIRAINQHCREKMLAAKAKFAADQFDIALIYLSQIQVNSNCYEDVLEMIDKIAIDVDNATAQERSFNLEIEKVRRQMDLDQQNTPSVDFFLGRINSGKLN